MFGENYIKRRVDSNFILTVTGKVHSNVGTILTPVDVTGIRAIKQQLCFCIDIFTNLLIIEIAISLEILVDI